MKLASSCSSVILVAYLLLLSVSSAVLEPSNPCPSCYIPCTSQDGTESSLVRTFSHQIEGCSLIIVLDAVTGEANIMYSNRRGSLYLKTIIVDDYEMSELCELFSSTPNVIHPNPQRNKAIVHFDQFPRQRLSLIDEADARYLYLFQKSRLLISKQKKLIDQLNNTVHTHEAFEREIVKKVETLSSQSSSLNETLSSRVSSLNETLSSRVSSLNSQFSLQYHNLQYHVKKDEMKKKLEYAIFNARISGVGYHCVPSYFKLQFPRSARNLDHCVISYPNWIYIDLTEELTLNRVQMYLYDLDERVATFTIQVSLDKANWNTVASHVSGKRLADIRLSRLYQARYIRVQGTNNVYRQHFAMHWIKLDWV